jgi:hypothetical protein
MLVVSIAALGGLVAFFFYHKVVMIKLERTLLNFEAELDYMEDVLQTVRKQVTDLERMMTPRSQVKKAAKKRGRPVNPNSVRQKKMKASN